MPATARSAEKAARDGDSSRRTESQIQSLSNVRTAVTRVDSITGQATIFAPQRESRPDQFQSIDMSPSDTSIGCPFCCGAESKTPSAVWIGRKSTSQAFTSPTSLSRSMPRSASLAHQADLARMTSLAHCDCTDDPAELASAENSRDWSVRVVPNKFPAITPQQVPPTSNASGEPCNGSTPPSSKLPSSKLFREAPVTGGHEVIIESPTHTKSLTDLGTEHLTLVLAAFRDRMAYWGNVPGVQYISVFKNCGGNAGASLAHSHSQLIAMNMMPSQIRETVSRTAKYTAETGCCLQCDLIRAEIKDKSRIVSSSDSVVAYCPFASPMPMSVRITTRSHCDRFEILGDETIESIARMLKRVASWIERILPGSAYNLVLNSCPPKATDSEASYHWSLDLFPRISRIAGFEFGSHCMINSVLPETAAAKYRQCAAQEDPRGIR